MSRYNDCISLISVVAEALDRYREDVVFVGGSVAGLLMTSKFHDVRPTDDVDVVVETASYGKYNELLDNLRKLGFEHDMNGPVCRLRIHGVIVDVMPVEESILGFKNSWYPLVMETATQHTLPNGMNIRLVTAPAFICTKLDAFRDRGKGDYLDSADIEDIIAIVNSREELVCECWGLPSSARQFLSTEFQNLLEDSDFLNAIPGFLPHGTANREDIVLFKLSQIARISSVESFAGQLMLNCATNPLSICVINMEGVSQQFCQREFKSKQEFLVCLEELNVPLDEKKIRPDGINELKSVSGISMKMLAKWELLRPLD